MKLICTFNILLIASVAFSQHYRTVISDTAVYFINDSGMIRAIEIDTTYLSGADTIYENFNTVRYDTAECDFGFYSKGASWMGEKALFKTDGTQVFFNKENDSIILQTLADTGTAWRLFELDSGAYLEGRVSAVTAENIFGVTDSVKTIVIVAIDNDGNTFAHPLSGKEIKISKHLGFIELLHFYEFPDDTMSYRIDNKGVPTRRAIFDFEVGDRIQRHITSSSFYGHKSIYSLHHYISKTFSTDSNTVTYIVAVDSHYYHRELNTNDLIGEAHTKDTLTIAYADLNLPVIEEQPGELFNGFQLIGFYEYGEYALLDTHSCGRAMRFINYPFFETSDSCLEAAIDASEEVVILIEGLGILQRSVYDMSGVYEQQFQFYEKSGCNYGALFTGVASPEINNHTISIYPNPASSEVTMHCNTPHTITSVTIHDVTGKQICTLNAPQQFPLSIATAQWSAGCYFVTVHTKAGSVKKKLLIQR